jgi:hypothetical protein
MQKTFSAFSSIIWNIAKNPSSILVILGLTALLMALLVSTQVITQLFLGGLGFHMLIAAIIVHSIPLQHQNSFIAKQTSNE